MWGKTGPRRGERWQRGGKDSERECVNRSRHTPCIGDDASILTGRRALSLPARSPGGFPLPAAPGGRGGRTRVADRLRAAPLLVQTGLLSFGLALAWMLVGPRTADLAAQTYRVWLFAQDGPLLWDNSWYGGHHLPGYSLVFPPLGALLGTRLVGLLAAVAATGLFAELARRQFGPRARAGALWFAAGTAADLAIGRLTYLTGVAFGLAALLAVQRRRPVLAGLAAVLCAVTSPIAGAFLALVAFVPMLSRRSRRAVALFACALLPGLGLTALFPEGGQQPFFLGSALVGVALVVLLFRALPRTQVELRLGATLYGAAIFAAWLVPSPMGGNAVRLGAGFAGALLLCSREGRGLGRSGIAVLLALAVWQWSGPVVEILKTSDNPATRASYFAPLLHELDLRGARRGRVEVVPTATRWEAVFVARRFALARGWETQLDRRYNPLFSTARLSPERYSRWLRRNAVHYVALPDVTPERFGLTEASVVARPQPFLRPVWHGRHWRLYAVRGTQPFVEGPGEIGRVFSDGFTLVARRPGRLLVRVHSSPWWSVTSGTACVAKSRSGWTVVRALRPGRIEVRALLTPHGAACPPPR